MTTNATSRISDAPVRVFLVPAILIASASWTPGALYAQPANDQTRPAPASLARFVDPAVGLFIEFDRLSAVDQRLTSFGRWMASAALGDTQNAASCPAAVALQLGLAPDDATRKLFEGHVALVAEDWDHFGDAVVLIDAADREAVDRALGIDHQAPVPINSAPHVMRSASGLWLALGAGSAALSRRSADESPIFAHAAARLSGAAEPALSAAGAFKLQMDSLPPRALGRIYVDFTGQTQGGQNLFLSSIQRCAAGLYRRDKTVEVELRTQVTPTRGLRAGERVAVERVLALPQTTLLAWTTNVDVRQLSERARHAEDAGLAGALAAFAVNVAGGEQAGAWLAKLGPRVVVAWGQKNEASGASAPQVGLLFESPAAGEVADSLHALAEGWLATISGMRPRSEDGALALGHETYLGTEIWSIPLGSLIAVPGSEPGPLGWVASVTPSFAAVGDWLVITLSSAHLKEIVDAAHDVIPTLRVVPGLQMPAGMNVAARPSADAVFAVAQPGLAAQVLSGWLADLDAGRPSPLDQHWWRSSDLSESPLQIGIGMDRKSEPGRVVVARVYRGLPADGRLQVGDRIIGVDDRLLSLSMPNEDLRACVQEMGDPGQRAVPEQRKSIRLRIMRHDEMLEVTLPLSAPRGADGLEPLRRLITLLRDVGTATYSVSLSGEHRMSAKLSLRWSD